MLTKLTEGACPKLPGNASPFCVTDILACFQHFHTTRYKEKTLSGSEAMLRSIAHLKDCEKKAADIAAADIAPLVQYRWLVPSQHLAWAYGLEKKLEKAASDCATKSKLKKAGSSSSKGGSSKDPDSNMKDAMQMFGLA